MIFPSLEKTSLSAIYTVGSILFIYIYFYLLKYAPLGINKTIWSDPLRLKSMMKFASQTMFMLINSIVGCLITVYSTNTCSSNFKQFVRAGQICITPCQHHACRQWPGYPFVYLLMISRGAEIMLGLFNYNRSMNRKLTEKS